jgi:hypothetical protein
LDTKRRRKGERFHDGVLGTRREEAARMRWLIVLLLSLAPIRAARAAPWEREIDDGMLRLPAAHRAGSSDLRAGSWFTLAGFSRVFTARREVAVMAVLGLALDRIAAGPVHAVSDRPAPPTPPTPPAPSTAPPPPTPPPPRPKPEVRLVLDAPLARGAVAAAWRAAGLGVDDAKIDAIVARARLSAVLPETRLRVMRMIDDGTHTDPYTTEDPRYYGYAGTNLWLEARLTWRLDRLLYSDDEPTLERVRLERIDARTRVASKILDLVFQWQRAVLDEKDAPPGTREELDAHVRAMEAEIALDVLTGGWFARARARPLPDARQSPPSP